jgi:hypothetical protein
MEDGGVRGCEATDGWVGDQATKLAHRVGIAMNPFRVRVKWIAFGEMKTREMTINQEDYATVYDMFTKSDFGNDLRMNGPVRVLEASFTCKKPDSPYVVNMHFMSTMQRVQDAMRTKSQSLVDKLAVDVLFETTERRDAFSSAARNALQSFNMALATRVTLRQGEDLGLPFNDIGNATTAFNQLFSPAVKDVRVDGVRVCLIMADLDKRGGVMYNQVRRCFVYMDDGLLDLRDGMYMCVIDGKIHSVYASDVYVCGEQWLGIFRSMFVMQIGTDRMIRTGPSDQGVAHGGEDEDDVTVVGNDSLDPIQPCVVAPADPVYEQAVRAKASDDSTGQFCVLV